MTDNSGENSSEQYYEMYSHLREELITRIQMHNKQRIRGLTAIAAIIGYALASQNLSVIALTPLIIGMIYLDQIRTMRMISASVRHMIDIEKEIPDTGDIFKWESKYGGYHGSWKSSYQFIDYFSPTNVIAVIAVLSYISLLIVSIEFWETLEISSIEITSIHISIIYAIFSLLLLISSISVYMQHQELEPER